MASIYELHKILGMSVILTHVVKYISGAVAPPLTALLKPIFIILEN